MSQKITKKTVDSDSEKFNFILEVLSDCVFDITYHNKLKLPLTPVEKMYFSRSIERIKNATDILNSLYEKNILLNKELDFYKKREGIISRILRLLGL